MIDRHAKYFRRSILRVGLAASRHIPKDGIVIVLRASGPYGGTSAHCRATGKRKVVKVESARSQKVATFNLDRLYHAPVELQVRPIPQKLGLGDSDLLPLADLKHDIEVDVVTHARISGSRGQQTNRNRIPVLFERLIIHVEIYLKPCSDGIRAAWVGVDINPELKNIRIEREVSARVILQVQGSSIRLLDIICSGT